MIVMPSRRARAGREQPLGLALVERGVGLVQDQDARTLHQEAADLHQLPLVDRQVGDQCLGFGPESDALKDRAGRARICRRSTSPSRVGC